jgi:hypothetical protein
MAEVRIRWLVALVGAAAFTFESWALGPYSWMYGYGAGLETIPTHLALHQGDRLFSPWAPFLAGGVDRYAFWGNADPLNWDTLFFALFPPWLANGAHRFVQYFIAIFFAATLCRRQLHLDARMAVLGGIFFACFSYFTYGQLLAIPALPLFLLLVQYSRESKRGPWLPLVVGLGFSTFTTFTFSLPYFAALAGLWSVLVLRDASARAAMNLGLIVLGLTLGDAPHLLAVLANVGFSHRTGLPPESVHWSVDSLLYRTLQFDYFNQDPFLKQVAWHLPLPILTAGAVILGITLYLRRGPILLAEMYLRVYAVYFLLSQRWLFITPQNVVAERLPWVRGIYMGRFFDVPGSFLIACQLALLVAILRELARRVKWRQWALSSSIAAFVALMLIQPKIFLFYRLGVDGWGQLNYQVGSLDRLKSAEAEPFRVASVLPLQPAYAYAQGLETADGWANIYPGVYREYWLQILAPLFKNVPAAKQIFDPDSGKPQDQYIFLGADLMHPTAGALPGEDPALALKEGFDVGRRFDLKLLGLLNVKYLLSELPLKGRGIELVHAPAVPPRIAFSRDWATGRIINPPSEPHGDGVRAKLRNAFADWVDGIRIKSAGKDVFIYRIADFMPRFRFVEEVRVEPTGQRVLASLTALSSSELSRAAVAEAADFPAQGKRRFQTGKLGASQIRSNELRFEVSSQADAFLVIGMTWNPYWQAEIDGVPTRVIRINHAQMGIEVPAGATTVWFHYAPPYLPFRWH